MATASITFNNVCSGASDSMKVYYGKTLLVTGTPQSGTGWTLYTGSPIAAGTASISIPGLDDNVQYTFYRYCHCPASGDTDPEIEGPFINYSCPAFQTTSSGSNQVDYIITIPLSANNSGTWITKILVELYDNLGTTLISSNSYPAPFSSSASGSFLGLFANTSYKLKIQYSNSDGSIKNLCVTQDISTKPACVPPTVSIGNLSGTSFDISWTVPQTYVGDSYNIVINSTTIATNIPYGSQPYSATGLTPNTSYSVQVVRNFAFGGQCTSTTQTIMTPLFLVSGTITLNCDDHSCSQQGNALMSLTFASPTPVPISLYFGTITYPNGNTSFTGIADGYDLFAIPPGVIADFGSNAHLPYLVNVPAGVTTFTAGTTSVAMNRTVPATGGEWTCQHCLSPIHDLYVKVGGPAGYAANFSIAGGSLLGSSTVHNL